MEPSIAGSVIAAVSGLGGAGSGLAILRHFALKWAEEREAEARRNAEAISALHSELDRLKEDCVERNTGREREGQLFKAELRAESGASVAGLREHTDKRIDDVVKSNHELREKTGVWMAKVEEQGRILTVLATNVQLLTDKVQEGIVAITALTSRLQGAGLLRRVGDKGDDA